jgi:hypothetical protein
METIQLIQTTPEQLAELINKGVKSQLKDLQKELSTKAFNDELLTRKEACDYLKIDSSTLWAWTNKGKVKAYGIANRRYYKRSELIDSLTLVNK